MERKIYSLDLETDKKYMEPGFPVQFAIIQENTDDGTKTQITFFRPMHNHIDVVNELKKVNNGVFVGAGKIVSNEAYWDSDTCRDAYGFDQPGNFETAQQLLESAQKEFLELFDQ